MGGRNGMIRYLGEDMRGSRCITMQLGDLERVCAQVDPLLPAVRVVLCVKGLPRLRLAIAHLLLWRQVPEPV